MSLRETTGSPWLRLWAALALLVFAGAQTLCFLHCHYRGERLPANGTGNLHCKASPSCHGAAAPAAGPGERSDAPFSMPAATCSTLKTMLAGEEPWSVAAPEFDALYELSPMALAMETMPAPVNSRFLRPARSSDWVFTPEVSLGPAFRGLAPPFFA
jgi:hypothetical protein